MTNNRLRIKFHFQDAHKLCRTIAIALTMVYTKSHSLEFVHEQLLVT